MKTVKHYTWEVTALTTPLIKKKCSKCNKNTLFYCSDKFRLNSQKKYLDVWLIYRCNDCDTTYNLTILSRTKPDMIDRVLLQKFMQNDEQQAWQYALDSDVAKRNQVEHDYSQMQYNIIREELSLSQIAEIGSDFVEFEIKLDHSLPLKLNQIIRTALDISSTRLDKMLSLGIISVLPAGTSQKQKIKNGISVVVDTLKLKSLLQEVSNE